MKKIIVALLLMSSLASPALADRSKVTLEHDTLLKAGYVAVLRAREFSEAADTSASDSLLVRVQWIATQMKAQGEGAKEYVLPRGAAEWLLFIIGDEIGYYQAALQSDVLSAQERAIAAQRVVLLTDLAVELKEQVR